MQIYPCSFQHKVSGGLTKIIFRMSHVFYTFNHLIQLMLSTNFYQCLTIHNGFVPVVM